MGKVQFKLALVLEKHYSVHIDLFLIQIMMISWIKK